MIVIPMAGMSSRFFNAGYKKPKYMLEAKEKSLFELSVNSFEQYFSKEKFLFIVKNAFDTEIFVKNKAKEIGIVDFEVVTINSDTRGQAETVVLGLDRAKVQQNETLTIFNIDTFRPNFTFPLIAESCDGYLEVFEGEGENWSFAEPESMHSTKVIRTAEKNAISNLCSTGLYYFKTTKLFLDAYYEYLDTPESDWEKGELYIAPLYNNLINKKLNIHYNLIEREDVIFCGTPKEYSDIINGEC